MKHDSLGNYLVLGNCLDKPPGAAIDRISRLLCPSDHTDLSCRNGKYLEKIATTGDK